MFGAGAVEGLHPTLQGSVASICGEGATAQIFTVLGTGETIGDFFSGPMMSRLVAIGRTASSPSSGVFFLVSSVSGIVNIVPRLSALTYEADINTGNFWSSVYLGFVYETISSTEGY
jgi:hypothetical protein